LKAKEAAVLSSESEIEVGNVDSLAAWGWGESRAQVAAAEAAKRPHLGVKSPLHSPAQNLTLHHGFGLGLDEGEPE